MNVPWRKEPLSEPETKLLGAVLLAHHQSSFRSNASTVAVLNAAAASRDLAKSIVAGIMTLGGRHAPIEQTCELLGVEQPAAIVTEIIQSGRKVPGWGGTFQKDQPDPIWAEVSKLLEEFYPSLAARLDVITEALHAEGKKIYPNPSAYTAASAIALGLPAELAVYLFIGGRLDAWTRLAFTRINQEGSE
jgi:citrate synthase